MSRASCPCSMSAAARLLSRMQLPQNMPAAPAVTNAIRIPAPRAPANHRGVPGRRPSLSRKPGGPGRLPVPGLGREFDVGVADDRLVRVDEQPGADPGEVD